MEHEFSSFESFGGDYRMRMEKMNNVKIGGNEIKPYM
jgi:hypothetical protein